MAETIELGIDGLSDAYEIGVGGFARVYAAFDVDFKRWVAVKVLPNLDEGGRRRFNRERELMGRLDEHPNVITPYRTGHRPDGAAYLVMEYAKGGSLKDHLDTRGPLTWEEALDRLLPIADAIGYAHANGIEHRDIKPPNILVTSTGITKLTDFGISRIREATGTNVIAFTLAHTPPETFADGQDRRDPRSDLYSLASTLYELVRGHGPFHLDGQDSAPALMHRIMTHAIPPLGGDPRRDAFLASALAKNPSDRPASAAEFITALAATRTGDPQNGSTELPPHPQVPAPAARSAGTTVTGAPDSVRPAAVGDSGNGGQQRRPDPRGYLTTEPLEGTGKLADATVPHAPPTDAPHPGSAKEKKRRGRLLMVGAVSLMAVAGIGAGGYFAFLAGPDYPVFSRHAGAVVSAAVLDDGRIASGGDDETVRVWDPNDADGTSIRFDDHTTSVESVAALQDGRVVSAGADNTVRVWNPDDASNPLVFNDHTDDVLAVTVLPDGRIASAGADNTVRVWNPNSRISEPSTFTGHTDDVWALAVLQDGRVVSGGFDETVRVWDPDDLDAEPSIFTDHDDNVLTVAVLADGRVASAGADDTVRVWDPQDPQGDAVIFGDHTSNVLSLAPLADGRIASAAADGTVRVWEPDDLG